MEQLKDCRCPGCGRCQHSATMEQLFRLVEILGPDMRNRIRALGDWYLRLSSEDARVLRRLFIALDDARQEEGED